MLEEKMKKRKVISLLAMFMGIAVFSTACGQTAQTQEGADTSKTAQNSDAVSTAASNVSSAGNASNAGSASNSIDLNSMTLDQITQKAKEDKEVDSVGMPDSWANWGQTWKDINSKYGITHNDSDMSSTEELQMFKTRTKASLIRGLASNEGLAQQLALYQTRYGDWRELFRYLDKVDKVSKADIKRVANKAFQDNNRTIGTIETVSEPPAAGKGAN